ncbi:MAG: B12-binding domain-containing radical SAM protein [Candidatus Freyarchaeota archaeon]
MRTLLVNTPYWFSECPTIPLGITYLAAVLEKNGFEVEVLDLLVSRYSDEKVVRKVEEYKPDVVGATSVTMNFPKASRILKLAKEAKEDVLTVIGGPHVTFSDVRTLREAPWIDVVVRGEGEYTLLDIVRGRGFHSIDGITYREDGEIVRNRDRKLIENLDELPFPARHLLPLSKYMAYHSGCSLITGRGCPHRCIFCVGSKMMGRRVRLRNPKLVVDEIEEVLGYGFDEIIFEDDTFTLNHKHAFAVCDEIISRGLKFRWCANARVDTVTRELLEKMKEAGCYFVMFGVESGNQEILDKCKKRITIEEVRKAVKMAKELGISILSSFILGLPGETKETIEQTMRFAEELGPFYGFHLLAPFPGSEVRERADELGIVILTDDWSRYDANRAVTRTHAVSAEYLNKVVREFTRGVMRELSEKFKKADQGLLSPEEVKSLNVRRRQRLAWHLLKWDLIEEYGRIPYDGVDPVQRLTERLYEVRLEGKFPWDFVVSTVKYYMDKGILGYRVEDGVTIWSWATSQELKAKHGKKLLSQSAEAIG